MILRSYWSDERSRLSAKLATLRDERRGAELREADLLDGLCEARNEWQEYSCSRDLAMVRAEMAELDRQIEATAMAHARMNGVLA